MKKIAAILATCAGTTIANAVFVLVPNGDFSIPGGDSWNQAASGCTVITYEATSGNTGGYGKIDNTAGNWGGVFVAEGGSGANPAGGGGILLGDLGLVAGETYDFSLDLIDFGAGGAMAGVKIESWTDVGIISDSGDQNFATTSQWATYPFTGYTIEPTATRLKVVPVLAGAGAVSVGFDNVGVTVVPEPSSSLLACLGAFALFSIRRRK